MRSNLDVECYFVNTCHTFITTLEWQILADRVGRGTSIVMLMYSTTSIIIWDHFVLVQLTMILTHYM
jgi:hypothetical protein